MLFDKNRSYPGVENVSGLAVFHLFARSLIAEDKAPWIPALNAGMTLEWWPGITSQTVIPGLDPGIHVSTGTNSLRETEDGHSANRNVSRNAPPPGHT